MGEGKLERGELVEIKKPEEVVAEFQNTKLKTDVLNDVNLRGLATDIAGQVYEKLSEPDFYQKVLSYIKMKNFIRDLALSTNKRGFKTQDELYEVMDKYCEQIALVDQEEAFRRDENLQLSRKMASNVWLYLMLVGSYVVLKSRGDMKDDEWTKCDINDACIAEQVKEVKGGSLSQVL